MTLLDVSRQVHDGLLFTVDDDTNLALSATVEHSDSPRPTRSRHEQSMDEWIEGISIVGRIAYAMLCIESAISAWGVSHSDKLLKAIDKLWDFTTSGALDVWDREIQAAIPGVAGFYDEQREEEEWRAGAEYFGFEHLEDSQQDALNWMIANAQEIGLGNLYAGYDSWCTAEPLVEVINTMQLSGLPLPPRGRVSLCRVQESDGWGVTQPREYFL